MSNKFSRFAGSEDMDLSDKLHVKHILLKLGFNAIKLNYFMVAYKDIENTQVGFTRELDRHDQKTMKIIARPDVIAHKDNKHLIIEIDGSVHKGNLDARPIYDEVKQTNPIDYIILNKAYLQLEGISWEDYLTNKIKSIV